MSDCASRRPCALGDGDLLGDQVDSRHRFGDRMLDLNACIHLQEIEGVALAIDQKFNGAGAAIRQPLRKADRGCMQARAQGLRQTGRGRFLDELLIAALDRAVTLAQMDDLAAAIA